MRPHAYSIQWTIPFRDGAHVWSNVFHYDNGSPAETESGHQALAVAIKDMLRPLMASHVIAKGYRVWGPTDGTKAESVTKALGDFSGAGTSGMTQKIPPEETVYASLFIGRSATTGRKRYLRKYLHVGAIPNTEGGDAFIGVGPLSSGYKTTVRNVLEDLRDITVGGVVNSLCPPNGADTIGSEDWRVGDHLHIRQLTQ